MNNLHDSDRLVRIARSAFAALCAAASNVRQAVASAPQSSSVQNECRAFMSSPSG